MTKIQKLIISQLLIRHSTMRTTVMTELSCVRQIRSRDFQTQKADWKKRLQSGKHHLQARWQDTSGHRKFIRSKENGMYSLQPAIPATSGISDHMSWYAREMIHTMHLHGYRQTELQRFTQLQAKNPHTSNTCHWI